MPDAPHAIVTPIAPFRTKPARIVTAPSYLIDRFVPDCEIIALPEKTVQGGEIRHGQGAVSPGPDPRGRLARLRGARPRETVAGGAVFDFRHHTPQNWAHFLINHLPVFFHVADARDIDWARAEIVLPANTPGYIRTAADLFGLRTRTTDAVLEGTGITIEVTPWTALRSARADWVRAPRVTARLEALDAARKAGPLPARVFLSRRKTRALSNEAEVAAWLAARGFETIYPEDLDAATQMRLFRDAETIVAIHGAGLAPLLYRPEGGRLRHLVELMPCGHMTDVYRVMADQVGCGWIGVRGRIKPGYVRPAYALGTPFGKFSLDAFEIDLTSLDRAFALIEHGNDAT